MLHAVSLPLICSIKHSGVLPHSLDSKQLITLPRTLKMSWENLLDASRTNSDRGQDVARCSFAINHLQTEPERSELCINRPLANKCIFLHASQCFTTVKVILGQKSELTQHTFVLHGLYVSIYNA